MATENKEAEQKYKEAVRVPCPENIPFIETWMDKYANCEKFNFEPAPIKFSIIFPSRERIELVTKLIESLIINTANLNEIEALIAIDDDDTKTAEFIFSLRCPFVKIFRVKRSLNFSRDYYSFLASHSKGKWIITANDDCEMQTNDWDIKAYEVLKDRPGVVYGWIEDGLDKYRAHGHGNYCCFPLQGRAGFEALGYIFPTRIPTWGADIWAKNLYDSVDSVVKLPITLMHYCHHNRTREQDQISKRIARNQVPFDMRITNDEVNKLLNVLKKEMVKANA